MGQRRKRGEAPGSKTPADTGVEPDAAATEEQAREAAEEAFVRGLIVRGEAAWPDAEGQLPPDATHEKVEERPGELPQVRRRRFSAY